MRVAQSLSAHENAPECAFSKRKMFTPLHISKFMKPPIFTSYDIANQLCWFAEYNKGGLSVAKQQFTPLRIENAHGTVTFR